DLNTDVEQQLEPQGASGNVITEVGAFEQLHRKESASFMLANFVDGADVGMVEGRGSARLALKTLHRVSIVGDRFRKKFQSGMAAQAQVLGFVHLSHPARTYLVQDTVVRNSRGMHGTPLREKSSPRL